MTNQDAVRLVVDAIAAIRDREIDAKEGAQLARASADLLQKMIPHCAGRWGWIWRATIYGAAGTLSEVAAHLDTLSSDDP